MKRSVPIVDCGMPIIKMLAFRQLANPGWRNNLPAPSRLYLYYHKSAGHFTGICLNTNGYMILIL
jgi:hypothetical protein